MGKWSEATYALKATGAGITFEKGFGLKDDFIDLSTKLGLVSSAEEMDPIIDEMFEIINEVEAEVLLEDPDLIVRLRLIRYSIREKLPFLTNPQ